MPKKLTPKMQDALDTIRANGGRVGNGLNQFAELGINGQSVNALQRRGLLRVEFDDHKWCWLVIVDEGCGADPCCKRPGGSCIFT